MKLQFLAFFSFFFSFSFSQSNYFQNFQQAVEKQLQCVSEILSSSTWLCCAGFIVQSVTEIWISDGWFLALANL